MKDDIPKINRLARALMEAKMAKSMENAVKMATDMIKRGEENIQEKIRAEKSKEGGKE
ncbi:hypothetical protein GF336_03065 [Candidatus Woesearchaeota archaeon]|nr:hypothetical protein [Candidatus Woesearchaeota archaeon]